MNQFPPFPPTRSSYSPSRPFPTTLPQHERFPAPPYNITAPPISGYPPFDAYGTEASLTYTYEQPRRSFESEAYDPYQPATPGPYDSKPPAGRPQVPSFASRSEPQRIIPTASIGRRSPPPVATHGHGFRSETGGGGDLPLLTEATMINLSGHSIAVHSLPPSHLPIEKYVAMNKEDAIEIHRQLCTNSSTIWYADGACRAGEAWSSAVEWIIDSGRSGSKMRGVIDHADSLDAELGSIYKAVEGFHEVLQQSFKDGKPVSHDLIVFCDSPAAIIGIDTSSRPEALRFEKLWRSICSEYQQARLKLSWLPRSTNIEGHVLANKIATVGASNSYLKRKKDGSLPDAYRRHGGGELLPSGSAEAGPWQRGDADPARRKSPFERPRLSSASPPQASIEAPLNNSMPSSRLLPSRKVPETEEENTQPRDGSIFVTHFPPGASAKDLGILFAQYGNIVAVDIYHISPTHPRFAFVTYTDPASGHAAIHELNRKPVNLRSEFAVANQADLAIWHQFPSELAVVKAEPPRLVPVAVADDFPDLPDWAMGVGKERRSDEQEQREVDLQISQDIIEGSSGEMRKRDIKAVNGVNARTSESPHKKARHASPVPHIREQVQQHLRVQNEHSDLPDHRPDNIHTGPVPSLITPITSADQSGQFESRSLSLNGDRTTSTAFLPPTPHTAQAVISTSETPAGRPIAAGLDANPSNHSNKRPLTNSASEPQEYPIKVGHKTLRAQVDLVRRSFGKVDVSNWIAHSCFVASDLNEARRALQEDLYATDNAFLEGRDLERVLSERGFTPQRVDSFITKVLKVLDGIALAEQDDDETAPREVEISEDELRSELEAVLSGYPEETKEALAGAATLREYLMRGKEAQERKRLEIERRVKVLEGMVKKGEVVKEVVRFLLSENK